MSSGRFDCRQPAKGLDADHPLTGYMLDWLFRVFSLSELRKEIMASDRLTISVTWWTQELDRFHEDEAGLHGLKAAVTFPADQKFGLFLRAPRSYELRVEGDVEQVDYDDVGNHTMRSFSIAWNPLAQQRGSGRGSVELINPLFPEDPCVFELRLGENSYERRTDSPVSRWRNQAAWSFIRK